MMTITYKCRAEWGLPDITKALKCLKDNIGVVDVVIYDTELELTVIPKILGFSDIIAAWESVPDLHVMIQTLRPLATYDGVRRR